MQAVGAVAGWIAGQVGERVTVRVWNAETGVHQATLVGHDGFFCWLAVHGGRLISGSRDDTILE